MPEHSLPVLKILPDLHRALLRQAVVLQAPPGAGKSTALPLSLLLQWPEKRWLLVQPRRLAALSIAQFVASQLGEKVGQQVGYQVRQQSQRSAATRLLIVTEGILTQILQSDPELSEFDGVIFDEFHERNLHSDLGLALVLESLQLRPELHLLVMSATLPAQDLADWLTTHNTPAQVLTSSGRQYPIEISYQPPAAQADFLQHTARVVTQVLNDGAEGILVFVPGQAEIKRLQERLLNCGARVLPLYGGLSLQAQQDVIKEGEQTGPKVVLATNIAETSLTIPGIDCVIDSGRERQAQYRPKYRSVELITRRIARAAAEQRAGRAGRLGPGRCVRLYGQSDWHGMAAYRPADIEQQDLTEVCLQVACWGSKVSDLAWFTPPNAGHIASATEFLGSLGALNQHGQITPLGQRLSAYTTDTESALALELSKNWSENERSLMALLVAVREERECTALDLSSGLQQILGSPGLFPRTYKRYTFWCRKLKVAALQSLPSEYLAKCTFALYRFALAKKRSGVEYTLATGAGVQFLSDQQPGQLSKADWLLVTQVSFHQDQRNGIIRQCLAVEENEVRRQVADHVQQSKELSWRGENGGIERQQVVRYLALELSRRPLAGEVSAQERVQALVADVQQRGLSVFDWNSASVQLLRRLRLWVEGDAGKVFSDQSLLDNLNEWAAPYWQSFRRRSEMANWQPYEGLMQLLDYSEQKALGRELPSYWQAPSGRQHAIEYQSDGTALVALKLQEVFGSATTPRVLRNRLPLTFDLLSPAGRALQRTQDLAAFWAGSYEQVKKEMRGRYPKHPWPDDPANAQPTHLTKKAFHGTR